MADVEYGFRKLEVWKLGMQLVKLTYKITKRFPEEEKFGLTSQVRRAAISIPLNISEGSSRRTKKDFASFVRIALGSLMEVSTCFEIALAQEYLVAGDRTEVDNLVQELYFKLIALDKFLSRKPPIN